MQVNPGTNRMVSTSLPSDLRHAFITRPNNVSADVSVRATVAAIDGVAIALGLSGTNWSTAIVDPTSTADFAVVIDSMVTISADAGHTVVVTWDGIATGNCVTLCVFVPLLLASTLSEVRRLKSTPAIAQGKLIIT